MVIVALALVAGGKAVKAVAFFYRVMESTPFGDKFGFHPPQTVDHSALGMRSDLPLMSRLLNVKNCEESEMFVLPTTPTS